MNLGKAVKQIRQHHGISQVELSERTGLSQTSISQIENGVKNPSKRSIGTICQHLNVPEAVLYVMGMEPSDVPESRKDIYQELYPAMRDFALQMMDKKQSAVLKQRPARKN